MRRFFEVSIVPISMVTLAITLSLAGAASGQSCPCPGIQALPDNVRLAGMDGLGGYICERIDDPGGFYFAWDTANLDEAAVHKSGKDRLCVYFSDGDPLQAGEDVIFSLTGQQASACQKLLREACRIALELNP